MRTPIAGVLGAALLYATLLGAAVLASVAPSRLALAQQKSSARESQAYTSVKDIMESIVDPSADVIWGAVGTVVDREGIHDAAPKTEEEWRDVRRAAVRIIEGGNLLMMPGRDAAPPGTKSEAPGVELEAAEATALIKKHRKSFDAFAKALQVVGLEALQASDAKNAPLLLEIGARMENVCESCHTTFWYPQALQPQKHAP